MKFESLNVKNLHIKKFKYLKSLWRQKNIEKHNSIYEQIYLLKGPNTKRNPSSELYFSFVELGSIFGITGSQARHFYVNGMRVMKTKKPILSVGRPKLLTTNQISLLKKQINHLETIHEPPTYLEMLNWINDKFKKNYSISWFKKFVLNPSNGLFAVTGHPLEKKRAEVSVDQIKNYFNELKEKFLECDPDLIFNMDESGLNAKKIAKKKLVLSLNNVDTTYVVKNEIGHLTFIPTISASGYSLRTMVIIQNKTLNGDLLKYGYPNAEDALVCSSSSGYITSDLFLEYVKKILIPEINARRIKNNRIWGNAVLIMDGARPHSNVEALNLLKINNITLQLLPPHSSHILQPLDKLIFSVWKREINKTKTKEDLKKSSKRFLNAMNAMNKSLHKWNILKSFSRSGIEIDLSEAKPTISVNINKVLESEYAPINVVKKKKRKRVILKRGVTLKEKKHTSSNI